MRRFWNNTNSSANQSSFSIEAKHRYKLASKLKLYNRLTIEREDKLGLNILGEELLTAFSYFQYNYEARLSRRLRKGEKIEFFAGVEFKDYDNQGALETLTYVEPTVGLKYEFKAKSSKLTAQVDYRDRRYTEHRNFQILDPSSSPFDPTPFLPFDSSFNYPKLELALHYNFS